jgi:hypothetical protein
MQVGGQQRACLFSHAEEAEGTSVCGYVSVRKQANVHFLGERACTSSVRCVLHAHARPTAQLAVNLLSDGLLAWPMILDHDCRTRCASSRSAATHLTARERPRRPKRHSRSCRSTTTRSLRRRLSAQSHPVWPFTLQLVRASGTFYLSFRRLSRC